MTDDGRGGERLQRPRRSRHGPRGPAPVPGPRGAGRVPPASSAGRAGAGRIMNVLRWPDPGGSG